jgi:Coenzyme PQQ synthesis protein D (PqqD)
MMSTLYRINRPKVISEAFEDEVVAVNFDTGSYYGMRTTALIIWNLLEQGASTQTLTRRMTSLYHGDQQAIGEEVSQFLEQLRTHNLIAEVSTAPSDTGPEPVADHRGPWEPPVLSVYEDMKDLLLLDPIHDVDEQGWPARKPDQMV